MLNNHSLMCHVLNLYFILEQKEELSSGTSEYFTESAENKKLKISLNEQIKQDILKEMYVTILFKVINLQSGEIWVNRI